MPIWTIVFVIVLIVVSVTIAVSGYKRSSLLMITVAILIALVAYKLTPLPSAQERVQEETTRIEKACSNGDANACKYLAEIERQKN